MAHSPPPAISEHWQELIDDADATAAEYEENGYETCTVHPGDVTPITGDPFGIDVLAPGNEFEAIQTIAAEAHFHSYHVYHMEKSGVRFLVLVVEGTRNGDDVAVLIPLYLVLDEIAELEQQAKDDGVIYTHVRPLSDDTRVSFTHEDPELFF